VREPSPVLGLRAALILLVVIAIAPVFAVVVQGSLADQRVRLQRAAASLKSVVDLAAAHQGASSGRSVLDLERAREHLRDMSYGAEGTLLVVDAAGMVRARAGPSAAAVGEPLPPGFLRDAILAGRAKAGHARDADGREWLFALQPVQDGGGAPGYIAGATSRDEVLAPAAARLRMQLAALVAITLAAIGLAWIFAGRVLIEPMRRLMRQVEALAQEEQRLDRPPPGAAVREFGELHGRFHAMARQLAERAVLRDGALGEMEHQKNLLESVLEGMAEGVLVVDRQGRFVHVNSAARRILPGMPGPGRSGLMASSEEWGIYELDGATPCPPQERPFTLALQGRPVHHYRYRVRGALSGGRDIIIQGSARPIAMPGQLPTGAVIVFSDITEAWRAERALTDSEQRYRTLFESNPHPMWVFDVATLRFLTVNDAAVAHYGYSREEFLAMTIADIRPPQDVHALQRAVSALEDPLGAPTVWRHRLKDGRLIHVEVTSHELEYDGRPARMVLAHDITERLLAQDALQHLNATLERRVEERTRELAVANQELESFSYSVSHDLRAPLQVIDGFGRALMSRHAERLDNQARHYLDRIRDNTRQMGQLIDDLLALARVTRLDLQREPFDLAPQAQRVVDQLRQRFPERTVQVRIEEPLPCNGDPRLLAIVMENLINNAWKFSARVAQPLIEVGRLQLDSGEAAYFVRDNGAGFDIAYADKLFKPFQRLHAASDFEGTGIGLATVHRIVTRHGGRVWAEAEPGRGAMFLFTLPAG
jgi:PAS domain S-box-containing protein